MGRPKKNPDELKAYKNVTMDAEVAAEITLVIDELEKRLGFRPTISQAIKHLIKSFNKEGN